MSLMVEVKTEELIGPALGWAIESIENDRQPAIGQLQLPFCAHLIDEVLCEKLITKYSVWVEPGAHVNWLADTKRNPFKRQSGETRVIAVYRAIVADKRGDTVQVPAELMTP